MVYIVSDYSEQSIFCFAHDPLMEATWRGAHVTRDELFCCREFGFQSVVVVGLFDEVVGGNA